MKRREFITLLSGAVVAGSPTARAQNIKKIPKVGILWHAGNEEEEAVFLGAVRQGFKDLGYVEGHN